MSDLKLNPILILKKLADSTGKQPEAELDMASMGRILQEELDLEIFDLFFFDSNFDNFFNTSDNELKDFLTKKEAQFSPNGHLYFPISFAEELIGFMSLKPKDLSFWDDELNKDLAMQLCDYISSKILNSRTSFALSKEEEFKKTLDSIFEQLSNSLDLAKAFDLVLEELTRVLDVEYALILKKDKVVSEFVADISKTEKKFIDEDKTFLFKNSIKSFVQHDLHHDYVLCLFNLTESKDWQKYELGFVEALSERLALVIAHSILYKKALENMSQQLGDLEDKNQELIELGDAKTQLINNVSHELRTPLVSIMGFSNVLLRHEPTAELVKESSEQILNAGQRLSRLVDDFIVLNRAESQGWKTIMEPLDIGEMAQFAVGEFAPLNPRHQFEFFFPDDYPLVNADRKLLRQVVDNLIMNSIKYSPRGGLVSIGINKNASELELFVRDQGMGIASEELEKIFERFYRVKRSETEAIGGMGLGLAICKDILNALKGDIRAESNIDRGSCFFITLPVAE